ncbi:MAG TPA: glycosyltransferase [Saprospiraceae bacterium]|nr:glycosyltransferase [Saprospiraceae bacterium]
MTFDLIITTYNRPAEVFSLVCQALECNPAPEKVIVVDSSDEVHTNLLGIAGVWYIRSSHKNQPYQRLLGATAATSDIVVFFDDDLIITNSNIFTLILNAYQDKTVIGASVAIDYHSSISSNLDTAILPTNNKVVNWFWKFTGVTFPHPGAVSRLGIVGPKPTNRNNVEYFHGPCMSFKRKIVKHTIPEDLLAQTELKVSMGEDKVISMLSLKFGKLVFNPILCLYHPPNQSTYFNDSRLFIAKTIYSRLYLSRIYSEMKNKSYYIELIIFYWFAFWRLIIALVSMLVKPSQSRKDKVIGTLDGIMLAITRPHKSNKITPHINWEAEIKKDITIAKHATG